MGSPHGLQTRANNRLYRGEKGISFGFAVDEENPFMIDGNWDHFNLIFPFILEVDDGIPPISKKTPWRNFPYDSVSVIGEWLNFWLSAWTSP